MRILILHQEVPADAPPDERDVLVQAQYVAQALVGLGHAWAILPVDLPLAALREQLAEELAAEGLEDYLKNRQQPMDGPRDPYADWIEPHRTGEGAA